MRINSLKQSLICSIYYVKDTLNVKWMLDYIKHEFIYWHSWMIFVLMVSVTTLQQLEKFSKNSLKKSGLHRKQSVIELDVFVKTINLRRFHLESL
jgi:hypothetical protein